MNPLPGLFEAAVKPPARLTIACALLFCLQACTPETTRLSEVDRRQLRAEVHERLLGNTAIANRDTWQVLAAGSANDSNSLRLFYRQMDIERNRRASGKDQNQPDYWNREHVWPQSYGLRGTLAARDLHNIVPADRTVNTSRGNKFFDGASKSHKECTGCRASRSAWEPPDIVKGDVARILYYMDLRYEGGEQEPQLSLSDEPDKDAARFGRLSTLHHWHCQDPVSAEERQRNQVVHEAQGNRNLFVDQPELAQRLYGFDCT